jgi:hypothetical protein
MYTEIRVSNEHKTPYHKCEVISSSCRLKVYDQVTPETIIGKHPVTGQEIRAALPGHVATAYFNPMHNSLMIMLIADCLEPSARFAGRLS